MPNVTEIPFMRTQGFIKCYYMGQLCDHYCGVYQVTDRVWEMKGEVTQRQLTRLALYGQFLRQSYSDSNL